MSPNNTSNHENIQRNTLTRKFGQELNQIKSNVLRMGGLVEQQIEIAIGALMNMDLDAAINVIHGDTEVNALERTIDALAVRLIACHQPVASDLRLLIASMKIASDLERMGDEAQKIGRMTKLMIENNGLVSPRFYEINAMSTATRDMLRKSLDAYVRLDVSDAIEIIRDDQSIDELFRFFLGDLIQFMLDNSKFITQGIELLWIAKAFERMGDHAKNIGEHVIYAAIGEDVRHGSDMSYPWNVNPLGKTAPIISTF